ncbi:hypothetical protein HDU86_003234 [Geranomyces michiganensis]|nr:hypothetical protein HDU86_003234 [Geranomyces michiganensis]
MDTVLAAEDGDYDAISLSSEEIDILCASDSALNGGGRGAKASLSLSDIESLSFDEIEDLCAANPALLLTTPVVPETGLLLNVERPEAPALQTPPTPTTPHKTRAAPVIPLPLTPPASATRGMLRPPIVILASNLAACVGLNRYCSIAEAAETVFARSYPRIYRKALARNGQILGPTVEEILQELSATAAVELAIASSAKELSANLHSLLMKVGGVDSELAPEVKKHVYQARGLRGEATSLDKLETTMKQAIGERNDRVNVLQIDVLPSGRQLNLRGRVDGVAADGTLIEIKNRQRGFAGRVRLHEKVQLHAYMELTGKQSCIIAETYDGETRTDVVEFNIGFWSSIVSRLVRFARHIDRLVDDEGMQDLLLTDGDFPCDFVQDSIGSF